MNPTQATGAHNAAIRTVDRRRCDVAVCATE